MTLDLNSTSTDLLLCGTCRCPNFRFFFSSPNNDTELRHSSERETLRNFPIWIIFIITVNHFQIKFSFKPVHVRHELLQSDLFLRLLPELPERSKSEENLARSENKIIIKSAELWQIDRFIRFMLLLANWFQSRWTWLTALRRASAAFGQSNWFTAGSKVAITGVI